MARLIVGRWHADRLVLQAAAACEQAAPMGADASAGVLLSAEKRATVGYTCCPTL